MFPQGATRKVDEPAAFTNARTQSLILFIVVSIFVSVVIRSVCHGATVNMVEPAALVTARNQRFNIPMVFIFDTSCDACGTSPPG
jgi:hypothetical protein